MSVHARCTLRLRLDGAEGRISSRGNELISLRWGVVQQPEFGTVFDTLRIDSDNEFVVERVDRLLVALRIPHDPRIIWDQLGMVERFLAARRRYVLAHLSYRTWDTGATWTVDRYMPL